MKRLTLLAVAAVLAASSAHAHEGCAASQVFLTLGGFPPEASRVNPFYYAAEDAGSTTFTVSRSSHDCSGDPASAAYSASDGSATSGSDYSLASGRTVGLYDPSHDPPPHSQQISVSVVNDPNVESGIESATIALSDPNGASLLDPFRAPLYVVDDDAPNSGFSFAEPTYSRNEGSGEVAIPVFRSGNATAAASVNYSVGPGGEPAATASADYTGPTSGTLTYDAGQRIKVITLTLVNDDEGEDDENVRIGLEGTGVSEPSSVALTIVDNEENLVPSSRFHHPRHDRTYARDDYKLREIHIFTEDEGGSGVVATQFALRRKMKDGTCGWFTGEGFRASGCADQLWLPTRVFEAGFFYYYRMKTQLKPSIGTAVKAYTAFARARDAAGNEQTNFEPGSNANTFEVKRA